MWERSHRFYPWDILTVEVKRQFPKDISNSSITEPGTSQSGRDQGQDDTYDKDERDIEAGTNIGGFGYHQTRECPIDFIIRSLHVTVLGCCSNMACICTETLEQLNDSGYLLDWLMRSQNGFCLRTRIDIFSLLTISSWKDHWNEARLWDAIQNVSKTHLEQCRPT